MLHKSHRTIADYRQRAYVEKISIIDQKYNIVLNHRISINMLWNMLILYNVSKIIKIRRTRILNQLHHRIIYKTKMFVLSARIYM